MPVADKIKILFLCNGNSCRSQMAEGWSKALKGLILDAFSAGMAPQSIDGRAVKVMAEAGVDISAQQPKSIDELGRTDFDYVITLCDAARESCPYFPGPAKAIHHGFDDPPFLAASAADETAALAPYRRIRDEIRAFIEGMPANLTER